ncbi:MAG TPA: DUF6789 family protein [Armatimonadota bacterium]|nr:DUF6789 family protein [Armatimonadota bacterium]
MPRRNTTAAITAGFVGWLLMTIWIYTGRYLGLPKTDIAKMIGGSVTGTKPMMVAWMSTAWWYGMVIHFVLGTIVFALVYLYVVLPMVNWSPIVSGLFWGLVLWVVFETVILKAMGVGFLYPRTAAHPLAWVIEVVVAHIIYGLFLGYVYAAMVPAVNRTATPIQPATV